MMKIQSQQPPDLREASLDNPTSTFQAFQNPSRPNRKSIVLFSLLFVAILLIGIGMQMMMGRQTTDLPEQALQSLEEVVATVGSERVFASDVTQAIPFYPEYDGNREDVLKALIDHSIIIQAAAAEGIVEVPDSLLDNPYRNQHDRNTLVREIREAIESRLSRIEGSVVMIYFINDYPGAIGVDAGRRLARETIENLHNRVRTGEITMQQAGEIIASTASLVTVDPQYQSNAYFDFSIFGNEPITNGLSETDEQRIRQLSEGQVSEILTYRGKDRSSLSQDNQTLTVLDLPDVDTAFLFAQVSKRVSDLPYQSFEDWYESKRSLYSVTE